MENDEEVKERVGIVSSRNRSEDYFEETMIDILLQVRALV